MRGMSDGRLADARVANEGAHLEDLGTRGARTAIGAAIPAIGMNGVDAQVRCAIG